MNMISTGEAVYFENSFSFFNRVKQKCYEQRRAKKKRKRKEDALDDAKCQDIDQTNLTGNSHLFE